MKLLAALILAGALIVHAANSAPVKRWQAEQTRNHICERAVLKSDWRRMEHFCR